MTEGQPGGDQIAERGHRRQADSVPKYGRVPAEFTPDRPENDRDQPEQGRAHQELGLREVGGRGRLPARATALGDLQGLAEQFDEPLGGSPRGALQHLVLLVDMQDLRASGRYLGGSAASDRTRDRVQDVRGRVQQLSCTVPPGSLRWCADVRVGERGDDRPDAFGEASGAVKSGRTGAGLRRRHGRRVPGHHQRLRIERRGRVMAQPAGVVRHGGQGVGERVPMRRPTADREQQDQRSLYPAPERDHPGVIQGLPYVGGQGDSHQHAADRRRRDDPGGRSDGPGHPRHKSPYGQQGQERHESPRCQVTHEGAERQTRTCTDCDHLARAPGALESGATCGVGA